MNDVPIRKWFKVKPKSPTSAFVLTEASEGALIKEWSLTVKPSRKYKLREGDALLLSTVVDKDLDCFIDLTDSVSSVNLHIIPVYHKNEAAIIDEPMIVKGLWQR